MQHFSQLQAQEVIVVPDDDAEAADAAADAAADTVVPKVKLSKAKRGGKASASPAPAAAATKREPDAEDAEDAEMVDGEAEPAGAGAGVDADAGANGGAEPMEVETAAATAPAAGSARAILRKGSRASHLQVGPLSGVEWPGREALDAARHYTNKYRNALLGIANLAQQAALQAKAGGKPAPRAASGGRFSWPNTPGAMSELASVSHLGCVAARVLNIEKVLFPLLEGSWATVGEPFRKQWAQNLTAARKPTGIAKAAMQLEESLRAIAIGDPDAWFHGPESRKAAQIEDARTLEVDETLTVGRANSTVLRRPAEQAKLPRGPARFLARKGGLKCAPRGPPQSPSSTCSSAFAALDSHSGSTLYRFMQSHCGSVSLPTPTHIYPPLPTQVPPRLGPLPRRARPHTPGPPLEPQAAPRRVAVGDGKRQDGCRARSAGAAPR